MTRTPGAGQSGGRGRTEQVPSCRGPSCTCCPAAAAVRPGRQPWPAPKGPQSSRTNATSPGGRTIASPGGRALGHGPGGGRAARRGRGPGGWFGPAPAAAARLARRVVRRGRRRPIRPSPRALEGARGGPPRCSARPSGDRAPVYWQRAGSLTGPETARSYSPATSPAHVPLPAPRCGSARSGGRGDLRALPALPRRPDHVPRAWPPANAPFGGHGFTWSSVDSTKRAMPGTAVTSRVTCQWPHGFVWTGPLVGSMD